MNAIKVLVKSIFLNSFRSEGKKKKGQLNTLVSMLISGGVFAVLFVVMTIAMGPIFKEQGLFAEFLTMIFAASQFIVLIFGTVLMINIMFFSKDAELLLSLPVKPAAIFVAKIFYVYLTELMLSAFMVAVTGVTFGIVCGFGFAYYLLLLLALFIVPMVPLIISALLSIPIMYVISFFKNKSILSTILLIGIFGTFMYFYMNFFGGLSSTGDENFVLPSEAIRQSMSYMIPNISLARIVTLTSLNYLNDVLFVLIATAGLFSITLLISTFTYKKGMSTQLEEARSNIGGELVFTQNSAVKSILLKEVRELIRNPGLAFYCLFQVVMAPIMIAFYGTMDFGTDAETGANLGGSISQGMGFFFVILMVIGINYTALSSISREGTNFNMSKVLPVPYMLQIRAKLLLANIVMLSGLVLSFFSMAFLMQVDILQIILFFGFGLILGSGFNNFLIYLDAKNPKLDWESITVALKNSKASFISVGISMAIGLPFFIGHMMIGLMVSPNLVLWVYAIFWAIFYGIAIFLNFFFRRLLNNNIERMIAEFEN